MKLSTSGSLLRPQLCQNQKLAKTQYWPILSIFKTQNWRKCQYWQILTILESKNWEKLPILAFFEYFQFSKFANFAANIDIICKHLSTLVLIANFQF